MSYSKFTGLTELSVAKRFSQQFKSELILFSQQIQNSPPSMHLIDYTSLLLKRLLVLYFLQKQHLLDGDLHYLSHHLQQTQQQTGDQRFYRQFLLPLCSRLYNGKAQSDVLTRRIGIVPMLPLPIFKIAEFERAHLRTMIPDYAFVRIFAFFELYNWQIDCYAPQKENEIRPDIVGHILEHTINQKLFGAYYTQEDITTYIASNAIIACLFANIIQPGAGSTLHSLLQNDPDRYIHSAIRNPTYLVAETDIEYEQRQRYYKHLYAQLQRNTLQDIEELVTYNLDLLQLAIDIISSSQDYAFIVNVYQSLKDMLILDPTCGTGAFLFAALMTLAPLYKVCIERLLKAREHEQDLTQNNLISSTIMKHRNVIFEQVEAHPNVEHFILSTIIRQNLYGVELMPAAVDICQLRFSLTLLAHGAPGTGQNYPLCSNIRTGNALLGDIRRHPHNTLSSSSLQQATSPSNEHGQEYQYKVDKPFHWYEEFPILLERGGFDIIIGNPPYLEYSRVKQNYDAHSYTGNKCGNLYAAVIERSLALCRTQQSYLGLIVPISICSGERFVSLRQRLSRTVSTLWLANFEIFPCRLFENAFQRVSIVLAARRQSSTMATLHVTRTHRWFAQERVHLLQRLIYTRVESNLRLLTFPKLASPHQERILQKMLQRSNGEQIATFLQLQETPHFVYYQEATNYWMKATCHIPYYKKNGEVMPPTHGRFLFLAEERSAKTIMALMNSSLFYIWFSTYADGFHLSHALVKAFPVQASLLTLQSLYELANLLEKDIQRHRRVITHNTKKRGHTQQTGHQIEIEEYRLRYSKSILDEVDKVLAQYYSFTHEELEFIINYDIKYRLSKRGKK